MSTLLLHLSPRWWVVRPSRWDKRPERPFYNLRDGLPSTRGNRSARDRCAIGKRSVIGAPRRRRHNDWLHDPNRTPVCWPALAPVRAVSFPAICPSSRDAALPPLSRTARAAAVISFPGSAWNAMSGRLLPRGDVAAEPRRQCVPRQGLGTRNRLGKAARVFFKLRKLSRGLMRLFQYGPACPRRRASFLASPLVWKECCHDPSMVVRRAGLCRLLRM